MRIAYHYVAPVLAAGAALIIVAATASALAEPLPARITDAPMASPDAGGVYCGQFCGAYNAYGEHRGAPVSASLSAISVSLPVVNVAGVPIR